MSKDEAVSDEVSSDGQLDSGQVPTEAVAPGDALEVSAQSAPVAETAAASDETAVDETVSVDQVQPEPEVEASPAVEEEVVSEVEVEVEEEVEEEEEELNEFGFSAADMVGDDEEEEEDEGDESASPIEEFVDEQVVATGDVPMNWYILKVQVNREKSICEALRRSVRMAGMQDFFGDILVPTEDVREFTKAGKPKVTKRKLYPGYVVVYMAITDESWFLVRDTSGIGDFAGAAGRPSPLSQEEVDRIIASARPPKAEEGEEQQIKTTIPFKVGDRVRVKEGYFQNYEGDVSAVDERNGRIEVMVNIFGRPNPVDMDHWHVEMVK